MISASGVTRRYGSVRALAGVDLEVGSGETAVVFGANGAGKTTLLRICAGLLRPTSGLVRIGGRSPREARGRIGYVGHQLGLYPFLTVQEHLSFFARLHGVAPSAVEPLLERLGLASKRGSLAHTLSHGEARRLALARALLHDPGVVIADEPFSGLDEASAAALPGLLEREGRTLLIATHDVERGKAMADRILWLEGGRIRP